MKSIVLDAFTSKAVIEAVLADMKNLINLPKTMIMFKQARDEEGIDIESVEYEVWYYVDNSVGRRFSLVTSRERPRDVGITGALWVGGEYVEVEVGSYIPKGRMLSILVNVHSLALKDIRDQRKDNEAAYLEIKRK